MITRKTIKLILIIKTGLLLGVLLTFKGGFFIGDRTSTAQEETAAPTIAQGAQPAAESEEEYEYADDGQRHRKRKSFLDKLLKIPTLDTESLKKDEISRYLTIVERKRQQVEARVELLKEREAKLVKIEEAVESKLKLLDDERRLFAETIQQERNLKNDRTKQLVAYYGKMPPKKAAPMFEQMNKDLVVELFNQLPEKQITNVLSIMNPQKAVELSEYYGRVRSGREYDLIKEMNQSLRDEFNECKGMPKAETPPSTAAMPQQNNPR